MKNKKVVLAVAALVVVVAAFLGIWKLTRPETNAGGKNIVVEVVHKDGTSKEFSYQTDAEYLGEVLLGEGIVEGENGDYGLYIKAVDGETADYAVDGGWWCLTQNGEMTVTGADQTVIADGDHFELTYTIG